MVRVRLRVVGLELYRRLGDARTDHLQGAAGERFAHPLLRRHEGDADGCTGALQDLGIVRMRGEDGLEHGEPFGGHEDRGDVRELAHAVERRLSEPLETRRRAKLGERVEECHGALGRCNFYEFG